MFASPRNGQPWGKFSVSKETIPSAVGGPDYGEESTIEFTFKEKVSETSGGPWPSLLLARLRFKPDAQDPTLL